MAISRWVSTTTKRLTQRRVLTLKPRQCSGLPTMKDPHQLSVVNEAAAIIAEQIALDENDVDDRKPPRQKRYESTSTGAPRSCAHGHRRSETTSDSTTTRETLPPKVQTVYLNYCKRPEFQEMFWTWWAQLLEDARSPGSSSIVPTRLSVASGYACQVNILLILWTCC